jgi:hypothetical protein
MKLVASMFLSSSLLATACSREGRPQVAVAAEQETTMERMGVVKIRLTTGATTLNATLADNETARDFASLLPLTLTMNDLFRREKYAHLPRAISAGGKREFAYEIGQIIDWSPGPDVAVFYRSDGEPIPSPGIIVLGKVESGVEALDVEGLVEVRVELGGEP